LLDHWPSGTIKQTDRLTNRQTFWSMCKKKHYNFWMQWSQDHRVVENIQWFLWWHLVDLAAWIIISVVQH